MSNFRLTKSDLDARKSFISRKWLTKSPAALSTETLDEPSAIKLARKVEKYWHSRGYKEVIVWVMGEYAPLRGQSRPIYVVRSNLKNGLPPREVWALAA
jgi:hypothetical protein